MKKNTFLFILIITYSLTFLYCSEPDASTGITVSVTASSTLKGPKDKYNINHLLDGNSSTSWCEGIEGKGIGESFTIIFDKEVSIKKFFIKNGYGDAGYFFQNSRARELKINGYAFPIADDDFKFQKVELGKTISGKEFKFEISKVDDGNYKWLDTCISEISFQAEKPREEKFPMIAEDSKSGWKFILLENGGLKNLYAPPAQCETPFISGRWTEKNGEIKVNFTYKWDKSCPDMEGTAGGPTWVEEKMEFVLNK